MDEVKDILMYYTENGDRKHICADFAPLVRGAKSISELVKLYKREPSWAMSVHYPSHDVMKKYFNNVEAREEDVYVDRRDKFVANREVAMFNNCHGTVSVTFDLLCFPAIYVGLSSNLKINVSSPYAEINVYDDAKVVVDTAIGAQCRVFRYGSGEIISESDHVKIIDKRDETKRV